MTLRTYLQLRRRLMRSEGFRSQEYRDTVGKLTIGFGYNVDGRGEAEFERVLGRAYDGTITRHEALMLLDHVAAETEHELRERFHWFDAVDPVRQTVILDMAYNMGVPTFASFKQTILAITEREYVLAARRMLQSKWARQVGKRAQELARMMETGALTVS